MKKKIKQCTINEGEYKNTISVIYDDGSTDERFSSYYPDELYFEESEFVGLTEEQARDLIFRKDVEYLRS